MGSGNGLTESLSQLGKKLYRLGKALFLEQLYERFNVLRRHEECKKRCLCIKRVASTPAGLLSLLTAMLEMEKLLNHSVHSSCSNC